MISNIFVSLIVILTLIVFIIINLTKLSGQQVAIATNDTTANNNNSSNKHNTPTVSTVASNTNAGITLAGSQTKWTKRDCDLEMVYSNNDQQCNMICRTPGVYVSRNGACVNALTTQTKDIEGVCDPKLGVLAFLVGDTEFGTTRILCLSVDPGIQSNNPKEPNLMCKNGTIDINYMKEFPSTNQCMCGEDGFPALIEATSTTRQYVVCVNNSLRPIFNVDII